MRQHGFTLIEVLVVVAILGVISAVAIPNLLDFRDSGATEAAKAERHNLTLAVSAAMYDVEMGEAASFVFDTTPKIWDPNASGVDKGNPAYYLYDATEYKWAISSSGYVSPGSEASGNPLGS